MPADFLMPLFVLTLLANAVLVAFAIRGMRHGQFDPDRPSPGADRAPTWTRSGSEPQNQAASGSGVVRPELPTGVRHAPEAAPSVDLAPSADQTPAVRPTPVVDPAPDPQPAVEPSPEPAPPARTSTATRRRRPATSPATGPATSSQSRTLPAPAPNPGDARPAGTKRGRRRFSLPNLDDDHEKVSRSIETFLGGADVIGGDGSTAVDDRPASIVTGGGATTVVLVAIAGLPPESGATGPRSATKTPRRRAVEPGAVADVLALVERTLRNAARGTDSVTGDGRGRFRIVMASTGELAARAYLRRVRTTIEPGLEAARPPLRLVVATATVLDESVEVAIRRATDRLSAAFDAAASVGGTTRSAEPGDRPDDASSSPRAAVD